MKPLQMQGFAQKTGTINKTCVIWYIRKLPDILINREQSLQKVHVSD